jgi:hypothetical protein
MECHTDLKARVKEIVQMYLTILGIIGTEIKFELLLPDQWNMGGYSS